MTLDPVAPAWSRAIRQIWRVSGLDRVLRAISRPRLPQLPPLPRWPVGPARLTDEHEPDRRLDDLGPERHGDAPRRSGPRSHDPAPLAGPPRRHDWRAPATPAGPPRRCPSASRGPDAGPDDDPGTRPDRAARPGETLRCDPPPLAAALPGRSRPAEPPEPDVELLHPRTGAGPIRPRVSRADARIAAASKFVVVQSEGMRRLLESVVPEARGKTVLLPPGIPAEAGPRADVSRPVRRLLYTGKFHPFYPVERMIDFLTELRAELPDLEFHIAGDKIMPIEDDPGYQARLRSRLETTPGVVWHGSLPANGSSSSSPREAWHSISGTTPTAPDERVGRLDEAPRLRVGRRSGRPDADSDQVELFGPTIRCSSIASPKRCRHPPRPDRTGPYRSTGERVFEASRAFTYPAIHRLIAAHLAAPRRVRRLTARGSRSRRPGR